MQHMHDGEEKHHVKLSPYENDCSVTKKSGPPSNAIEKDNSPIDSSTHDSSPLEFRSADEQIVILNHADTQEQSCTQDGAIEHSGASSGNPGHPGTPNLSYGVDKVKSNSAPINVPVVPIPYPSIEITLGDGPPSNGSGLPERPNEKEDISSPYPEGGPRAWSVVFGSFCGMTASFGVLNSVGTFQAYLSTHQLATESPSSVGWIFSLLAFLTFFCGVQIGPIFDAKGPRWLVAAGSVCLFVGMMGVAEKLWHFIITYSVPCGVGSSLIFTPAVGAVAHFFSKRRAAATGLATTGGSIGGIVFPLTLQRLFPILGFKWSVRILAFIFLFLLMIANLLIRSNPKIRPPEGSTIAKDIWPDLRIYRHKIFAITTAGAFFIEWALFIPLSYISSYAIAHDVNGAFSYQLLAVLNAGSFFGRWLPGYMADRCGRFNAMIATCTLCLVSVLCIWLTCDPSSGAGGIVQLCFFAVIFGIASGSNISLTPPCVGQLCDTEVFGRWYASLYTIVSFGCLTGIPIVGEILARCGGKYWGLILFTGLCYGIGVIFFIWARVLAVGWGLRTVF